MNIYQILNQDLREFNSAKLIESEEVIDKSTPVTETESVDEIKKLEDRIGELRIALEDDTLSEDEKEAIIKEISELEIKLDECNVKECNNPIPEGDETTEPEEVTVDMNTEEHPVEEVVTDEVSEEAPEDEECKDKDCISEAKDIISNLINSEEELSMDSVKECLLKVSTLLDKHSEHSDEDEDNEDSEEFEECEIKSYRITRVSPKFSAYMIEAETKDGLRYITGKNYSKDEKTLDEAEITDNKDKATDRFRSLLK